MSRQAVWINSVLTSDLATAEDKTRVKAAAVLFANVLFDSDFVPMFDGHGLNMGTANMPVQQGEYRDLYALFLAHHPMMKERVESARQNALANLHHTVNESGAHMAGTHYIGASMGPLLSTLQQLQTAGICGRIQDGRPPNPVRRVLPQPAYAAGGALRRVPEANLGWRCLD